MKLATGVSCILIASTVAGCGPSHVRGDKEPPQAPEAADAGVTKSASMPASLSTPTAMMMSTPNAPASSLDAAPPPSPLGRPLDASAARDAAAGDTAPPPATPTPSVDGGAPAPVFSPDFLVQYKDNDKGNNLDRRLYPALQVRNLGAKDVPLAELTLRYYFTADGLAPIAVDVYWAEVTTTTYDLIRSLTPAGGAALVTTKVVTLRPAAKMADTYVEIGFPAAAGSLKPFEQVIVGPTIHKDDFTGQLDETNDYSYDGSKTTFAAWERVTAYRSGKLIWGLPPSP